MFKIHLRRSILLLLHSSHMNRKHHTQLSTCCPRSSSTTTDEQHILASISISCGSQYIRGLLLTKCTKTQMTFSLFLVGELAYAVIGEWAPWSGCSVTCGVGIRTRNRTCLHPPLVYRGVKSAFNVTETQRCNLQTCSDKKGTKKACRSFK